MLEGVCGASSIVVSFYAGIEFLCGADVETAVSARKHVDVIHLKMPAPRLVPLVTRSGHHSTREQVIPFFSGSP